MIDLYTWTTPNGRKISILLEELGVPYTVHAVNVDAGEQWRPEFQRIAPAARIPAIVDSESGFTLMESGAIMLYLAERFGQFLPGGDERWRTIEWLMWQMGSQGPFLGQLHHFRHYNPGVSEYGEARYAREAERIYRTLETRLADRDFVAGEGRGEYTIADMAIWPWISRFEWQKMPLADYPRLCDWYLRIAERPAVVRGYHQPKFVNEVPKP